MNAPAIHRFEGAGGGVSVLAHATGPVSNDVVLVNDEPVEAARAEGRLTAREARAQGLIKAHGSRENDERLSALLDRTF